MKLIVGLGNPGANYQLTRHNAGFMAVDQLAAELGLSWQISKKLNAELAKNADTILLKPLTFMNNSGSAVAAALAYFKLRPEDLTVIHDDLDIDLGKFKLAEDSRSAGHNGVESIIGRLGTKKFKRVRLGIKPADLARRNEVEAAKFVLQKFPPNELKTINLTVAEAIKQLK